MGRKELSPPPTIRLIDPTKHSANRLQSYNAPRRSRKKVWGVVLGLAGVAGTVTGGAYVLKDQIVQACIEHSISSCSARAEMLAPPAPVVASAKLAPLSANQPAVSGMASYVLDPHGVTVSPDGKTLGMGVTMSYDTAKFYQVFGNKAPNGTTMTGPAIQSLVPPDKYLAYVLKNTDPAISNSCAQDLRSIVDAAKSHAGSLQQGIKTPSAADVTRAENTYSLAPYTSTPDNPAIPNIVVYFDTIVAGKVQHNGLDCMK